MGSFSVVPSPLVVTRLLFWGVILAGTLLAVTDRALRATSKRYAVYLLLAIIVTVAWRLPVGKPFFLGMEYEDAYVYSVVARQLLQGTNVDQNPASYLTTVCDVGSLQECESSTTYSGHYIGSPYVISLAASVLGYRPEIGAWVGIGAACLSVVLIFLIARLLYPDNAIALCSAGVFAMTPVFAVHGIAAYAEPLSNLCVTLGVLAYLRYLYARPDDRTRISDIAALGTWSAALLFGIVVKRENLVLAFALPLVSIIRQIALRNRTTAWYRIGAVSIASVVALAFSVFSLRFGEVLLNETAEFHRIPFGLTQVRSLLPAFLASFGSTEWYCLGGLWVLVGLVLIRRHDYLTLYPAVLIIAYLTLYVSHVRSYYQVNYADVTPGDALRYAMNFMSLWALIAGVGVAYVIKICRGNPERGRWRTLSTSAVLVIYAATAYRYSTALRNQASREEQETRIAPAIAAAQTALSIGLTDTYIITLEPLVIQLYAPSELKVIDLTRVNAELVSTLAAQHEHLNLLYLDNATYRNEIDQERYQPQLRTIKSMNHEMLREDKQFGIVRLQVPRN